MMAHDLALLVSNDETSIAPWSLDSSSLQDVCPDDLSGRLLQQSPVPTKPSLVFAQISLVPVFDIDWSSVSPRFDPNNGATLLLGAAEAAIPQTEFEVEHEVVFRMPPEESYTVNLRIRHVRMGQPRFVEPE